MKFCSGNGNGACANRDSQFCKAGIFFLRWLLAKALQSGRNL
jgi:hypothetical protein